ncbi:hypothetical protein [Actinoplanes regularis]|uniref:Uncharacterized protein n=1 Tax=Actinoplanes regularis TaxID=52697 RepID=A0A239KQP5_9ACTN|nr:hypothetical protein [Actinoplanes regularis]SNT19943.1 hypothetical protein SAMN06264365_1633 [Actinoplanes regularis]
MINAVSAGMGVILSALYQASIKVEQVFTGIRLCYDISVPGLPAEDVSYRGTYPLYLEHDGTLTFYCMEIGLPYPSGVVSDFPSEIRLSMSVRPHERGFTIGAGIEVDLVTPLHNLEAGEHQIMSRTEEQATVSGAVAAIGHCQEAFAEHYDL